MRATSGKLVYDASLAFAEDLEKIQRKDNKTFDRIRKVVDRLRDYPRRYDRALKGSNQCQFEKYVGKDLARIVYTWCRQCRSCPQCPEINACDDCDNKTDNTLRLFDVFYKNEAADRGYTSGKKKPKRKKLRK